MGVFLVVAALVIVVLICCLIGESRDHEFTRDLLTNTQNENIDLRRQLHASREWLMRNPIKPLLLAFFLAAACFTLPAAHCAADEYTFDMAADSALFLPKEVRAAYRNPDGSCVQCSIGMCGQDQNDPNSANLLWDTEYGRAERGGSTPQRVKAYCERRGIRAYNITGDSTFAWMKWATRNGRGAAIGAGRAHFQTLCDYDGQTWYVCNNNSTHKVDRYDDSAFHRLHMASGPWVVILDQPPHPPLFELRRWW